MKLPPDTRRDVTLHPDESETMRQARLQAASTSGDQAPFTAHLPAMDASIRSTLDAVAGSVQKYMTRECTFNGAARRATIDCTTTHVTTLVPKKHTPTEVLVAAVPGEAFSGVQLCAIAPEAKHYAQAMGVLLAFLAALDPVAIALHTHDGQPLVSAYIEFVPVEGSDKLLPHELTPELLAAVRLIVVCHNTERVSLQQWLEAENMRAQPMVPADWFASTHVDMDTDMDAEDEQSTPSPQANNGQAPAQPAARTPKMRESPYFHRHLAVVAKGRQPKSNPHVQRMNLAGEPSHILHLLPTLIAQLVPGAAVDRMARERGVEIADACPANTLFAPTTVALILAAANAPGPNGAPAAYTREPYADYGQGVAFLRMEAAHPRPQLVLRLPPVDMACADVIVFPLSGIGPSVLPTAPPPTDPQTELLNYMITQAQTPQVMRQISTETTAQALVTLRVHVKEVQAHAAAQARVTQTGPVITNTGKDVQTHGQRVYGQPRALMVEHAYTLLRAAADAKNDPGAVATFMQQLDNVLKLIRDHNTSAARAWSIYSSALSPFDLAPRLRMMIAAGRAESVLRSPSGGYAMFSHDAVCEKLTAFGNMMQGLALLLRDAAGSDMPLLVFKMILTMLAAADLHENTGWAMLIVGIVAAGKTWNLNLMEWLFPAGFLEHRLHDTAAAWRARPTFTNLNARTGLLYSEIPFMFRGSVSEDGQTRKATDVDAQNTLNVVLEYLSTGEANMQYGVGARKTASELAVSRLSIIACANSLESMPQSLADRGHVEAIAPGDQSSRAQQVDLLRVTPARVYNNTVVIRLVLALTVDLLGAQASGFVPESTLYLGNTIVARYLQNLVECSFLRSMTRTGDRMTRCVRMLTAMMAAYATLNKSISTLPDNVRAMPYAAAQPLVLLHAARLCVATPEMGQFAIGLMNKVEMPETRLVINALRELLADKLREPQRLRVVDGDVITLPYAHFNCEKREDVYKLIADVVLRQTHQQVTNATVAMVIVSLSQQSAQIASLQGYHPHAFCKSCDHVSSWHTIVREVLRGNVSEVTDALRSHLRDVHAAAHARAVDDAPPLYQNASRTRTLAPSDSDALSVLEWMITSALPTYDLVSDDQLAYARPGKYPEDAMIHGTYIANTVDDVYRLLVRLVQEPTSEHIDAMHPTELLKGKVAIVIRAPPPQRATQTQAVLSGLADLISQTAANNAPNRQRPLHNRIEPAKYTNTVDGVMQFATALLQRGVWVPPIVFAFAEVTMSASILSLSYSSQAKSDVLRVSRRLFVADYKTTGERAMEKLMTPEDAAAQYAYIQGRPLASNEKELRDRIGAYMTATGAPAGLELPPVVSGFQNTILYAEKVDPANVKPLAIPARVIRNAQTVPMMCGTIEDDRVLAAEALACASLSEIALATALADGRETAIDDRSAARNLENNQKIAAALLNNTAARVADVMMYDAPSADEQHLSGDLARQAAAVHLLQFGLHTTLMHNVEVEWSPDRMNERAALSATRMRTAYPGCQWPMSFLAAKPFVAENTAKRAQVYATTDESARQRICAARMAAPAGGV